MIKVFWHAIVIFFYTRSGVRFGIDQESSFYTGDITKRYYVMSLNFWTNLYQNLGYRLIDDSIWCHCLYDKNYYKSYLKQRRFI